MRRIIDEAYFEHFLVGPDHTLLQNDPIGVCEAVSLACVLFVEREEFPCRRRVRLEKRRRHAPGMDGERSAYANNWCGEHPEFFLEDAT